MLNFFAFDGNVSFHPGNTDYGALIRNLSQPQYYMSLPNTIGERNYYLRNMV